MTPTPQLAATAAYIFEALMRSPGEVVSFTFSPDSLELTRSTASSTQPVPMTTAHGAASDLLAILASFEGWSGRLTVSGHYTDALCEFWITD